MPDPGDQGQLPGSSGQAEGWPTLLPGSQQVAGWPGQGAVADSQRALDCGPKELVFMARAMAVLSWYEPSTWQALLTATERDALGMQPYDASTLLHCVPWCV